MEITGYDMQAGAFPEFKVNETQILVKFDYAVNPIEPLDLSLNTTIPEDNTPAPTKEEIAERYISQKSLMDEIIADMNKRSGCKAVIAGGAVRDWLLTEAGMDVMPKDYDVFLLDSHNPISPKSFDTAGLPNLHNGHGYPYPLIEFVAYDGHVKVQIMITACKSMAELIAGFDWDICKAAYDGTDTEHKFSVQAVITGYHELMLGQVHHSPEITLKRGLEFCKRYNCKIDRESLWTLINQVYPVVEDGVVIDKEAFAKHGVYPHNKTSGYQPKPSATDYPPIEWQVSIDNNKEPELKAEVKSVTEMLAEKPAFWQYNAPTFYYKESTTYVNNEKPQQIHNMQDLVDVYNKKKAEENNKKGWLDK